MQTLPSEHAAPLATQVLVTQQPPPAQVLPAQQVWLEAPQLASGASAVTSAAVPRASTVASGAIHPPVPPEPPAPPAPPVEMGPSVASPVSIGASFPPTPPVVTGVSLPSVVVPGASTAASRIIEPPVPPAPPMPPAPPVEMGPSGAPAPPVPVGPSFPPTPPVSAGVSLPSMAAGTSVSPMVSGALMSVVAAAPSWKWRSLLASKVHAAASAAIRQGPRTSRRAGR